MRYLFELGFSQDLSLLELQSVFDQVPLIGPDQLYQLELDADFDIIKKKFDRLGGTVRVFSTDGKVVWRHKAKDWIKKDALKPNFNRKKGLLPPKIARMMVNFALGSNTDLSQTVLDPFCGSGTILIEAASLGQLVLGVDINREQVEAAIANLSWFGYRGLIHVADSTAASTVITEEVDCIVTEPFLGKPKPELEKIPNIAKGLKKLYLGCLKDWLKILKVGARVVMIFPIFETDSKQIRTSEIIDDRQLTGYNTKVKGLVYYRPGAITKREIVILEKK